jgi:hypothetical protein
MLYASYRRDTSWTALTATEKSMLSPVIADMLDQPWIILQKMWAFEENLLSTFNNIREASWLSKYNPNIENLVEVYWYKTKEDLWTTTDEDLWTTTDEDLWTTDELSFKEEDEDNAWFLTKLWGWVVEWVVSTIPYAISWFQDALELAWIWQWWEATRQWIEDVKSSFRETLWIPDDSIIALIWSLIWPWW